MANADPRPARPATPLGGAARALHGRNYRLFFIGQAISLTGTWMQQTAVAWVMFQVTASTWFLGLVAFCGLLPTLLLAPFAGALADRISRLRILWITQSLGLLQAAALATVTWGGHFPVATVLGLELALGLVTAFDMPTRQALVPALVERPGDLPNAIALNATQFNLARLAGPMVAGGLIAWLGAPACFAVNALSYVAVLLAFAAMRLPAPPPVPPPAPLWTQVRVGLAAVRRTAPIRECLLLLATLAFFGQSYTVLLPAFVTNALHGGALTQGTLTGAVGLGALTGALYMARRATILGLGRVLAGAGSLFGLAIMAFAWSRSVWLSSALLVVAGLGMMLVMAGCNTIVQTVVDDAVRGRVMSLYAMAFAGASPLGSLAAGALAGHLGAPWAVSVFAVGVLVGAGQFAWRLPQIRAATVGIYRRKGILGED